MLSRLRSPLSGMVTSISFRGVGHGDAEMDLIVLVEGVRHFIELEVEMGKTGGR